MILKKSKKANLEKKRIIFFQIGFIASISLALIAFEWSSPGLAEAADLYAISDGDQIIEVPITKPKKQVEPKKVPHFLEDLKLIDPEDPEPEDFDFMGEEDILDWMSENEIINEEETNVIDEGIVFNPSEPPIFSEGNFIEYVGENIVFPTVAQENGMSGKVVAKFIIDKGGNLTNIEILQSSHPIFEKAVLEVLKKSPKWTPGKQYGKPVKVMMAMPFKFQIK